MIEDFLKMSWFTEIAGKAEQMLEILDKNAAAALNTESTDRPTNQIIHIEDDHINVSNTTPSVSSSIQQETQESAPSTPRKSTLTQLRGSRTSMMKATRRKPTQDEEKQLLMNYLNGPSTSIEAIDIPERGSINQQDLISCKARIAEIESSLLVTRNENQRLSKELQELQLLKSESHFELSSEIELLSKKIKEYEAQTSSLAEARAQAENIKSELERELSELRDNFEKYRNRAQSVLNEKDNLISRLRSGSQEDEAAEQLENEEIVLLRQGSQQLSTELATLRSTLACRDEEKSQIARSLVESQGTLEALGQRYAALEQELRFQKEEGQRLREDMLRIQREAESRRVAETVPTAPTQSRTWPQQDAAADYVIDLDAKVRTLTATLVKKQQTVELLTAERNAMRLQLEKAEHKLQDVNRIYNRAEFCDTNTTDDAKARLVPGSLRERLGLMSEASFPQGMKRAYTAIGLASSVMRRHPISRMCMAGYLVVLHLWVICVLLSSTPESQTRPPMP
ncbi:hypothetical protein B566_EDAN000821 [Ephemera danica]|nr:hypothetical protein B566_EDAN000821 [Ephemera danica]